MNRIVTTSVAGLGVLASLTFAGSTSTASSGGGAARATTTNAHLVAVRSQPPVATVTMPGDAHGSSTRCVSIAATSCGSGQGSGVTLVRTSQGCSEGSGAGTSSCGSVSVAGASSASSASSSSGGQGFVTLARTASAANGGASSHAISGSAAAAPGVRLQFQAPAGSASPALVASTSQGEPAEILDLRALMARARGSNAEARVDAAAPADVAQGDASPRWRTRVMQSEDGAHALVLESVGDDADDEPCLGGDEDEDFAALDEASTEEMSERIQQALAAARDSMEERRAEMVEVYARARESAAEAQQQARERMAEAQARMRAEQEAAREAYRRASNGARSPRGGSARVIEVAPEALAPRASKRTVDGGLEARVEALERAARERGEAVGGPEQSLEERVALLERSRSRASRGPGSTGNGLFVRELPTDAKISEKLLEDVRRADAEARSSGQRRRSTWSPVTPPTPPTAPTPAAPPAPPTAPRAALAPFAPAAPTPRAFERTPAPGVFGSARDAERAELERAMTDLRSEAARLRAEVERMRAEIDRLPRDAR